jgi:hypothetical protein
MVFEAQGKRVVFCSVDLISIYKEHITNISKRVLATTGIPEEALMIGATHTHNGPVLFPQFKSQQPLPTSLIHWIEDQIAEAIIEAASNLQSARVGIGHGEEPSLVFNRRLKRSDGRILMNFVDMSTKENLTPSGPVDPSLVVIKAEDLSGNLIGMIFNYPNHNNAAGGFELCADWSGFTEVELQRRLVTSAPVLFFAGASADVNWLDFTNLNQTGGLAESKRIATVLADRIIDISNNLMNMDHVQLDYQQVPVELIERDLLSIDLTDDGCFGSAAPRFQSFFQEAHSKLRDDHQLERHYYKLTAIRIGNHVWISNPGELFVALGLKIKMLSPFGMSCTHICSLSNGYAGYIPTEEAFAEGGYEVRRSLRSSFLQMNAGTIFVNKSVELLNSLYAGTSLHD